MHARFRGAADHVCVKHGVGESIRKMAHTNSLESFWRMRNRAHTGTFRKMSPKHLDRYVTEMEEQYNYRSVPDAH